MARTPGRDCTGLLSSQKGGCSAVKRRGRALIVLLLRLKLSPWQWTRGIEVERQRKRGSSCRRMGWQRFQT
eukprot:757799-Hanusia_phi.AAC.2